MGRHPKSIPVLSYDATEILHRVEQDPSERTPTCEIDESLIFQFRIFQQQSCLDSSRANLLTRKINKATFFCLYQRFLDMYFFSFCFFLKRFFTIALLFFFFFNFSCEHKALEAKIIAKASLKIKCNHIISPKSC